MIPRLQLSAILLVAAVAWGVLLILGGTDVTWTYFKPFSQVVGVVVIALSIFDLWLWRIQFLQGWFVKRPVLKGTWRVEFKSDWVDPSTSKPWPTSYGFMTIRQSYSTMHIRFLSEESTSEGLVQDIVVPPNGPPRLYAVYRNEPRALVRNRSAIHLGTISVEIHGSPPSSIVGYYWTDRASKGELRLYDHRGELYDDYADALKVFGSPGAAAPSKARRARRAP